MEIQSPRWMQKLENYSKALERLSEIVNEYNKRKLNEFEIDCVIQRFEFTHEVAWKLMKSYAEYQGLDTIAGSRDASRWGFENHLISNGAIWMNMIRARNETSHNYDCETAEKIVHDIINYYFAELKSLEDKMISLSNASKEDLFSQE